MAPAGLGPVADSGSLRSHPSLDKMISSNICKASTRLWLGRGRPAMGLSGGEGGGKSRAPGRIRGLGTGSLWKSFFGPEMWSVVSFNY